MVVRELLIAMGFNLDESKMKRADQGISSIKDHAETAAAIVGRLAAVLGMVFGTREIIQMGDAWTNVYSRIGLVTKSVAEQAEMQEKVFDIAQRTRQAYEETGTLYYRMARNSNNLEASQQDVLDVTETINESLVLGGATAQEAKSVMIQLSQALASGRLQGEELRALSESGGPLYESIKEYFKKNLGSDNLLGAQGLGAQGLLTAKDVFHAILTSKQKMDAQFKKMPVTVEQSVTYALNRIGKLIFDINKETSVFQSLAKNIQRGTDWIAGGIERASKAAGGFANAAKMAAYAIGTLSLALWLFRLRATSIGWITTAIQLFVLWLKNAAKAAGALLLNPLFWKAAAIAAAIALIALALEDIYYWATDGESVLGDMIGPFSEWEATLKPITDTFAEIINLFKQMPREINYVQTAIEALGLAIQIMLAPFILLLKLIKAWQDIGGWGGITGLSGGVGVAPGFGVDPVDLAGGGSGGPVTITTGDVKIEQNIAGTGPQLARDVGTATAGATTDVMDKWARDMQFALP